MNLRAPRERVCLTHGRVLQETERDQLRCPIGPHLVTRWGVGNRATRAVEDAADADIVGTIDLKKAAEAARKEPDMPRGVKGSGPLGGAAKAKAVKVVGTKFTSGDEKLALRLVRNDAWGVLAYRVLIAQVSGKAKEKGTLAKVSTESDGVREYNAQVQNAIDLGWIEAGAGTLTEVPAPKRAAAAPKRRQAA